MKILNGKNIVVAGGTGNVGSFIVNALLANGANVIVPSRSEKKIADLRDHLEKTNEPDLSRLYTYKGNLSDEEEAWQLLKRITNEAGTPDATISSLGYFIPAPSLLKVDFGDLDRVMDGYLMAHFKVARTFLPLFRDNGGTFVFINGPLALNPRDGTGLVSIATAAQQILFKSLAKELKESQARVVELMNYAYIRNRQTQPSSTLSGKAVGAFVSWLISDRSGDIHGETIHLRSPDQLTEKGIVFEG